MCPYRLAQVMDCVFHFICFLFELRQGLFLSCDIAQKYALLLVQQGLCDVTCVLRLLHRTLSPKNRSIASLLSVQRLLVVFPYFA